MLLDHKVKWSAEIILRRMQDELYLSASTMGKIEVENMYSEEVLL